MAKAKAEKVYEVTIAGEYFAHVEHGNALKPYQVTVKMLEKHKQHGFLSIFKNQVAPKIMRSKYPDYGDHLATHRIVSVVDIESPESIVADPMLMNLSQLVAFIEHNELPVQVGLYRDEDELKQAVVDCIEDQHTFLEQQAKRQENRGKSLEITNELAALNPEIGGGLSTDGLAPVPPANVPSVDDVTLPPKPPTSKGESVDEFDEKTVNESDSDDIGL